MFQWNSSSNNGSNNPTTNRMRRTTVTAQSIHGTIRPPPSSEYTHAQHLDSYLQDETLKRSTRVVPPGNETFDTVFQSVQGDTFLLRVYFGDSRVPQMRLAGVEATHPWVDAAGCIVGYPPIQSATAWRDARLLLGQAVHHVVQELQVHPPILHRITDPALERIQSNHRARTLTQSSSQSSTTPRAVEDDAPPTYSSILVHEIEMPEVPTEFPELESLDREQLDGLVSSNELELQAYCHSLDAVKTLVKMTRSVVDDNAKLAQRNLEKSSELDELCETAKALQDQLRAKIQEFRLLEQQQDKLCHPVDPKKVMKELTKAKKEALDQSEQLADDWIENQGGAQVDAFLAQFLDIRKLHHFRAAKLELLEASR